MTLPAAMWTPFMAALNHVVAQQPQLGERLRAHAGKTARIVVETRPFPLPAQLDLRVGDDGDLSPASNDEPDATMTIKPSVDAAFAWMRSGREGVAPHVSMDGDPLLGAALGEVLRDMRWDYEEDLSRVLGDAAAHRIGNTVRSAGALLGQFTRRVSAAASRHATEPQGPLVSSREVDEHERQLRELASRVASLERALDTQPK